MEIQTQDFVLNIKWQDSANELFLFETQVKRYDRKFGELDLKNHALNKLSILFSYLQTMNFLKH